MQLFSINKNNVDTKEEGQMYARVIKLLGGGRLNALCDDGKERLCKLEENVKRVFIHQDNIILISNRDFEDNRADVIHKYNDDEGKILYKDGGIPKTLMSRRKLMFQI